MWAVEDLEFELNTSFLDRIQARKEKSVYSFGWLVVHLSTDTGICRSNLTSDIVRICRVLSMQHVEIYLACMHHIKYLVGTKEHRTKHSEGYQNTFTYIFSKLEWF